MPIITRIKEDEIKNRKNSIFGQIRIDFVGDKKTIIAQVKNKFAAEMDTLNLNGLITNPNTPKNIKKWEERINKVDLKNLKKDGKKIKASDWERRNVSIPDIVGIANEVIDWANDQLTKNSAENLLITNALREKEGTLEEKENKIRRLREIRAGKEKSEWTKDAFELNKENILRC